MQGLITLDFGNTNPKAGLFQKVGTQWDLIKVVPWTELALFIDQLKMTASNSQIVLAEVKSREEELIPFIEQGFLLTRVKDYWKGERFAGMPVHYTKTLGEDRLISAYYSYKKNNIPTLLIDAGTYVTMDVIDKTGLQGGYIIPGTRAYFSSFSRGEQLKDVSLTSNLSTHLPGTTAEAMRDSYGAFGCLARQIIQEQKIKKVVLTGGDAALWTSFFTSENTEIKVEPNFIHWALQHWMTTQIEPL